MSGEQPAGHLARLKRTFPLWSLRPVRAGYGFTAHRGAARLWAQTLPQLEAKLRDAEPRPGRPRRKDGG